MHIHMSPANSGSSALSGAQAAETLMALRRARELRETAARLKATPDASPDIATDPETVSMITAWSGGGSSSSQSEPHNLPTRIQEPRPAPSTSTSSTLPSPVSFWA
jgi:hypothetical protein